MASEGSLEVVVELTRERAADKEIAFAWGTAKYVRRLPNGKWSVGTLGWNGSLAANLARLRETPSDAALESFGEPLREFLRSMDWAADERQLLEWYDAGRAGDVVITLRFAAAELFALPWELAHFEERGPLGRHFTIRYEWPGSQTRAGAHPSEGGRILFAWAKGKTGVPADKHRAAFVELLGAAGERYEGVSFDAAEVTFATLAAALKSAAAEERPYTALHLLCHGEYSEEERTFGLSLADGWASPAKLRDLLGLYAGDLRLVVLCACSSSDVGDLDAELSSVALAIHRVGVESVLASRLPLSKAGSSELCRGLYRELIAAAPPRSLEAAVGAVREALLHAGHRADAVGLQLFSRSADGIDTRPFVLRPYRALEPFEPRHARFFHGHAEETREVRAAFEALGHAGAPRFLIVEGASGTGKSSLILCGVISQLEKEHWRWIRIAPGAQPLAELARATAELAGEERALLFVDQLEETWTQCQNDRERQHFVQELWRLAADPNGTLSVICTMRSDFRVRSEEIRIDDQRRFDTIFRSEPRHSVFLAQMGTADMRAAIEEPAAAVGLSFDTGLVDTILAEVSDEPGALPLVEFTLDKLWREREGRMLSADRYHAMGRIGGALAEHADRVLGALDAEHRGEARRVLVKLVARAGDHRPDTRRRMPLSSLTPADESRARRFDVIVERLVTERLLVRSGGDGSDGPGRPPAIELAHEALIRRWKTLNQWIADDREKRAELLVLESMVAVRAQYPDFVLTGRPLEQARALAARYPDEIDKDARALLDASEQALGRDAEHRRAIQWNAAIARAQDDDYALCAVLRAAADAPGVRDWRKHALRLIHDPPAFQRVSMGAKELATAIGRDQRVLVAGGSGGKIVRVRTDCDWLAVETARAPTSEPITAIACSDDGSVVIAADGSARVFVCPSWPALGEAHEWTQLYGPERAVKARRKRSRTFGPETPNRDHILHVAAHHRGLGACFAVARDEEVILGLSDGKGESVPDVRRLDCLWLGYLGETSEPTVVAGGGMIGSIVPRPGYRIVMTTLASAEVIVAVRAERVIVAQPRLEDAYLIDAAEPESAPRLVWTRHGRINSVHLDEEAQRLAICHSERGQNDVVRVVDLATPREMEHASWEWPEFYAVAAGLVVDSQSIVAVPQPSPVVLRTWGQVVADAPFDDRQKDRRCAADLLAGHVLATFGDGSLYLTELLSTSRTAVSLHRRTGSPLVQVQPTGDREFIVTDFDGRVMSWAPGAGGEMTVALEAMRPEGDVVWLRAVPPVGRFVARTCPNRRERNLGRMHGQIRIWSSAGEEIVCLGASGAPACRADVSPDGCYIAVGFEDGRVAVHDIDGKFLRVAATHRGPAKVVAFDPSGRYLLSAGTGWGARLTQMHGAAGFVDIAVPPTALGVFSPDGEWLLMAGFDGAAPLVATAEPSRLLAVPPQRERITAAAFLSDAILIGHEHGVLRRWKPDGSEKLHAERDLGRTIRKIIVDATGQRFAAMAGGVVLGLSDLEFAHVVFEGPGAVGDIAFSPSGERLAVAVDERLETFVVPASRDDIIARVARLTEYRLTEAERVDIYGESPDVARQCVADGTEAPAWGE